MLTRIDVESENAFFVPVLGVTPKDSLLIRKITGLNPPDIDLFIGDYSRDGGIYQGRRVGNRNIVITLDLNPNPALGETISGLRELLYKAFVDPLVDADYIKLNFHDDESRVRYLVGYTEKFETEIFDVETMAQISIICPDPYLRDNVETVHAQTPGWITTEFVYTGTAETGFVASIYISTATSVLTLVNNPVTYDPSHKDFHKGRMLITHDFSVGDVVTISTVRGERKLTVTPVGGTETSIVGELSPLSRWIELHSQANQMKIYGQSEEDTVASIQEIRYRQSYWGL